MFEVAMHGPSLDDRRVNALIAQHLFNMEPWPDEPYRFVGKIWLTTIERGEVMVLPWPRSIPTPIPAPDYCNDWSAFGALATKLHELGWTYGINYDRNFDMLIVVTDSPDGYHGLYQTNLVCPLSRGLAHAVAVALRETTRYTNSQEPRHA